MKPENRRLAEETLGGWGLRLEPPQWALLDNYLSDVLEYNRKVNLTAAHDEGTVVRRHFLDALAALPLLKERLGGSAVPKLTDIGSGGGFVGICLKVAWPEADMTLIESAGRKFKFLSWACARLGVSGLHVLQERVVPAAGLSAAGTARAEHGQRAGPQRGFDAVLARAVAPLPELVGFALPMGRCLLAWQSAVPDASEPGLAGALRKAGGRIGDCRAYRLPEEERDRQIVLLEGT
jgi:16S rRNA (guanine527-N7)-methyltransferase